MGYKPKTIEGKIKNTGWAIDGHILILTSWDYDNHESWHLCDWKKDSEKAVIETMFVTETEAGMCLYDTLEEFTEHWEEWEPQGSFCVPLENVDVVRIIQEEVKGTDTAERIGNMGDLISRNAVMDYLREQQANVIIEKNKEGFVSTDVCDGMHSAISAFMDFILQVPTDFDVDKVVEQLSLLRENAENNDLNTLDEKAAYNTAYFKSIEAVKSGGRQQDCK